MLGLLSIDPHFEGGEHNCPDRVIIELLNVDEWIPADCSRERLSKLNLILENNSSKHYNGQTRVLSVCQLASNSFP